MGKISKKKREELISELVMAHDSLIFRTIIMTPRKKELITDITAAITDLALFDDTLTTEDYVGYVESLAKEAWGKRNE